MDGSAPFQPWTSAENDVSIKDEKPSYDAKTSQAENVSSSGVSSSRRSAGPGGAAPPGLPGDSTPGADASLFESFGPKMDGDKIERMQQIVENTLSSESRQQITQLLAQMEALGGAERLLLYLKLPTGPPAPDPLKQPLNPLGSRSEIHQTVMWIQTHLEVDPEISLPKQDVYEEYIEYCTSTKMKPLSTADFGKVMKQVYPCVKPRRLGTRGNSRYCYAGMRKRVKLEVPQLPDLGENQKTIEIPTVQNDLLIAASQLIREWAEKLLGINFMNLRDLAQHLIDKNCVDAGSPAAHLLAATSATAEVPEAEDEAQASHKSQQRGVIKQLKRKIQSQPQISPGKPGRPAKKPKSADVSEADADASDDLRPLGPVVELPVKVEERPPAPYRRPAQQPPAGHAFPADYPRAHVSPAAPYNPGPQYLPPELMRGYRPPQFPPRHEYKYGSYYRQEEQPRAPAYGVPAYAAPAAYGPGSNLPMNLSNSGPEDFPADSLNLSLARDWPPRAPPPRPAPPARLPLPGKKMILEAYQNETMVQAAPPPPAASPGRGEYLPKKMRATESFGGKLAAARMASAAADLQEVVCARAEPPPAFAEPPQRLTRADLSAGLPLAGRRSPELAAPDFAGPGPYRPPRDYFGPPAPGAGYPGEGEAVLAARLGGPEREGPPAGPDVGREDAAPEPAPAPPRTATRGRPRKKSQTKAKYTRRQPPRGGARPRCDHSKHPKRSSDSCCSLTENINIRTGIICAEKHSEILNRERVISICNMDKHALDDYLLEGNSQENEEEIMQYFQHDNSDSQSDDHFREGQQAGGGTDGPRGPAPSGGPPEALATDSAGASDPFLESSLDAPEDRGRSNNDKISQLRELLERNLAGNRSSSRSPAARDVPAEGAGVPGAEGGEEAGRRAAPALPVLAQRPPAEAAASDPVRASLLLNRGLNARRRVSFETPIPDAGGAFESRECLEFGRGPRGLQSFSFVPISPGPLSPVGAGKGAGGKRAPPAGRSCTASPFVSPRNTPVPRARPACHKPQADKGPAGASYCNILLKNFKRDVGNFAVPGDHGAVPRSPKLRNFPMSAPPSPDILAARYKPSFSVPSRDAGSGAPRFVRGEHQTACDAASPLAPEPSPGDPLSREVSRFFSEAGPGAGDAASSLRSQSVPLHRDARPPAPAPGLGFMSYDNTPCGSVPPTPVPGEFCDFNLNDTCESISKAGLDSENLDKIYNVLDSNVNGTLVDGADGDGIASADVDYSGYSRGLPMEPLLQNGSGLGAMLTDGGLKPVPYEEQLQSVFGVQAQAQRPDGLQFDLGDGLENRFYASRSVPGTPVPHRRGQMPEFDLTKLQLSGAQPLRDDFASRFGGGALCSKSVPSTPLVTEERNVFSYSNRDFLINGNSVDPGLSAFADKKGAELDLVTFGSDCLDMGSEMPAFAEQGIANEGDLLGALDSVSYGNL